MFKFPAQFGDTVYWVTGSISKLEEEYMHDGKRYIKYHIENPTHEFKPLTVFSTAGDNVLTERGLTEVYDGNVVLTMEWDNVLYIHVNVVDQFYLQDRDAYWHNIYFGEGQPDWWA
jgi:hypothetical protein